MGEQALSGLLSHTRYLREFRREMPLSAALTMERNGKAVTLITDLLDQAHWEYCTGRFAEHEQHMLEYFRMLKEFENDPQFRPSVMASYAWMLMFYERSVTLLGKYDKVLPLIRGSMRSSHLTPSGVRD